MTHSFSELDIHGDWHGIALEHRSGAFSARDGQTRFIFNSPAQARPILEQWLQVQGRDRLRENVATLAAEGYFGATPRNLGTAAKVTTYDFTGSAILNTANANDPVLGLSAAVHPTPAAAPKDPPSYPTSGPAGQTRPPVGPGVGIAALAIAAALAFGGRR